MWAKMERKKTSTFIFGMKGGAVASSESCLVLLSASALTVRSLNRWTPASWWSWEEEEEGFCWAVEAECAASRQKNMNKTSCSGLIIRKTFC